jgi:hypothetical protein
MNQTPSGRLALNVSPKSRRSRAQPALQVLPVDGSVSETVFFLQLTGADIEALKKQMREKSKRPLAGRVAKLAGPVR